MQLDLHKIQKLTSFDPTSMMYSISLGHLSEMIEKTTLVMPLFQRDLVWSSKQRVELFNFILSGKSALQNICVNIIDCEQPTQQMTFIHKEIVTFKDSTQIHSVVDGQQRISTYHMARIGHQDLNSIVFDLKDALFKDVKNHLIKHFQIPVNVLLNKDIEKLDRFLDNNYSQDEKFKLYATLISINNKFKKYMVTINPAKNLSIEDQILWFKVINKAGLRITDNAMKELIG